MKPAAAFAWPVRVYWEDTDAGGVVFYANYLKFFERARTEWLRAQGIQQSALRDRCGAIFVVVETTVKYHAPAHLDDTLQVTVDISEANLATLTLKQEARLTHAGTERLLAEGTIRIACVDAATFKPRRVPAEILEAIR